VFHRPLRWAAAGLVFAGTLMAGMSAVIAVSRLGTGSALVFAAVAVGTAVVGTAVLYRARWALLLTTVVFGGQVFAVVGTAWELATGIDAGKADELRRLGLDPTFGVVLNLVYSTIAVVLFCWFVVRWRRLR
jgi:uncharacterized membrane protein